MMGACVSLENVSFEKHIYIPGMYGEPCRLINIIDMVTSTFRNIISMVILKMQLYMQPVLFFVQNISHT